MIDELRERCAGLAFAPLPELTGPEGAPAGDTWFTAVEMRERVAELLAAQDESVPPGPRAMEALRILLRELIFCTAASVYLFEAAPRVAPDRYWFHYDGTVSRRRLVVAEITDDDRDLAQGFVTTVTPLVTEVCARSRVGARTLWSYVIDMIHFGMLNVARQLGQNRHAAWDRAAELAEELYAAGIPRRSRPVLANYGGSDDESWGVRGACCLDFTDGVQSMCLTCPLLDDEARGELWAVSKLRKPLDIRQA
ncbi:hypothetical protein [Allokutzneria albata]|uniref:Ferric iron reductase FhuF-like transporter n=1 Tax=Allokutzneria albata TaxID=211114 RepID=A0A1H0BIJ2_ALLAB|nr:hypothetical protein [Allokutzneria albata]SDN45490.1 hypothetical protein SAMN04489726_6687 [Allokutzneria albata]